VPPAVAKAAPRVTGLVHSQGTEEEEAGTDGGVPQPIPASKLAGQLGVCTATVPALCAREALSHVRVLNALRVVPGDLEAFIEGRRLKAR
jgi:hypothetical protein